MRELSEAAGVPGADILRILMNEGVMGTLNAQMDPEMTELVAAELGITIDFTTRHVAGRRAARRHPRSRRRRGRAGRAGRR